MQYLSQTPNKRILTRSLSVNQNDFTNDKKILNLRESYVSSTSLLNDYAWRADTQESYNFKKRNVSLQNSGDYPNLRTVANPQYVSIRSL